MRYVSAGGACGNYREISAEISGFWAFVWYGLVYLPP